MAVLINGNGNEAIYAQQDADWYAALMGGVTMITAVGEQFAYELLDANTIGVKDGVIITKEGRRIQVDTNVIDTFDIPTGAQGTTNYYIIGYHLVTDEESVQSAETFVQLMDNGTDTIPEGSFKEGDDDVYVSLYRVEQNDLTIGTITLLLPTVSDSMQQQISQINNDLSEFSYTVLYENESPTTAQSAQTLTLSDSIDNYDFLLIEYSYYNGTETQTMIVPSIPNIKHILNSAHTCSSNRQIYFNGTSATIGSGQYLNTYGAGNTFVVNNSMNRIYNIYGIKGHFNT